MAILEFSDSTNYIQLGKGANLRTHSGITFIRPMQDISLGEQNNTLSHGQFEHLKSIFDQHTVFGPRINRITLVKTLQD